MLPNLVSCQTAVNARHKNTVAIFDVGPELYAVIANFVVLEVFVGFFTVFMRGKNDNTFALLKPDLLSQLSILPKVVLHRPILTLTAA